MAKYLAIGTAVVVFGCSDPLYVGSDIAWLATHETADLGEWSSEAGGGSYQGLDANVAGSVEISTDVAHSGSYSAKLTRIAVVAESGPGLFRDVRSYGAAYYAAWFFVSEAYAAASRWTIMKFMLRDLSTGAAAEGLDLDLRNLPDGDYVLSVYDHDEAYQQEPIALPTPTVRSRSWFHLEAFYRATGDTSGTVIVWLDGREVYRLTNHRTARDGAYFSPCNVAVELTPSPAVLYVDDAAVSLTRLTPGALLRR